MAHSVTPLREERETLECRGGLPVAAWYSMVTESVALLLTLAVSSEAEPLAPVEGGGQTEAAATAVTDEPRPSESVFARPLESQPPEKEGGVRKPAELANVKGGRKANFGVGALTAGEKNAVVVGTVLLVPSWYVAFMLNVFVLGGASLGIPFISQGSSATNPLWIVGLVPVLGPTLGGLVCLSRRDEEIAAVEFVFAAVQALGLGLAAGGIYSAKTREKSQPALHVAPARVRGKPGIAFEATF